MINAGRAAANGDLDADKHARVLAKKLREIDQAQSSATAEPTFGDQASAVGKSLFAGLSDPILGVSQLLARGGRFASTLGGAIEPNAVSRFFDDEAKLYDRQIAEQEEGVSKAREIAGFNGFDASRLAGNIANPVNFLPILSVAEGRKRRISRCSPWLVRRKSRRNGRGYATRS